MPLTVDVDTYATLAEYEAYGASYGWTLADTDDQNEINLRLGRRALDASYAWKGQKSDPDQPLAFPRDGEETPQAIKDAQCEMAYLIQNGADPLAPISGGGVKREKVDVIETEFFEASSARTTYPAVDGLVAGLHNGKAGGKSGSVPLVRV